MPEFLKNLNSNQGQKETLQEKPNFVCACNGGLERSVKVCEKLQELGYSATLIPSGLEGLEAYMNNDSNFSTLSRLSAGGMRGVFLRGRINEQTYEKLLHKQKATWLLFLNAHEKRMFSPTIDRLRNSYGLNIVILESSDIKTALAKADDYIKKIK